MKSIVLLSLLFASTTFAKPLEINTISCHGKNQDVKVVLEIKNMSIEKGDAVIGSYSMTVLAEAPLAYGLVPSTEAGSMEAKNIENVAYKGQKYAGHLKFPLGPDNQTITAGNMTLQYANLIFSPNFKVAKSIKKNNFSDKTWTWEHEIRQHSAVLDFSINDHHGDYLPLKCYSTAHVNDSKNR